MRFIFVLSLYFSLVFIAACNKKTDNHKEVSTELAQDKECSVQEDFDEFFLKFHSDSMFQMNRIIFPLEGFRSEGEEIDSAFYWNKEDWVLHENTHIDTTIFTEEKVVSETEIIHKVYIKDSGFYIERVFNLINCKWYLVYYEERSL